MQDNFEISKDFNLPQKETRKMNLNKNIVAFIGIGLLLITILAFFGYQYVSPFGARITYKFTSEKNKDKVSSINGAEPSNSISNNATNTLIIPQQIIRNEIVTFNLKLLSKEIEGIWVNLKFKGDPKEIKIGVRGSEKEKYHYRPLYNQILNSLSWSKLTNDKTILWQREKKYESIESLASKPPIADEPKVASYFYNLSDIVMKKNTDISQDKVRIEKTLRGSHTLLLKVDKKPLSVTVVKQDANAYKGKDELLMQIYNDQNKVVEKLIPDDGVIDVGGLTMAPQKGQIKVDNIKPGMYSIVLKDMTENADIRIKSIEVNQSSLVFQTPVFLIDEEKTTFWTNSKKITMRTQHESGLQTVKLDGKSNLEIEKMGVDFPFDLNNSEYKSSTTSGNRTVLHRLEIPKNDLIITGDGYFASSEKSFFNPEPIETVDLSTVSDLNKIDYIIASYQSVKKNGDWKIAKTFFDPKDIKIDGDKLYFSLESPKLSEFGGEIAIDSIEVTVDKSGQFDSSKELSDKSDEEQLAGKQNPGLWSRISWFMGTIWTNVKSFFENLWPFKTVNSDEKAENSDLDELPTDAPSPTPLIKQKYKISVQNGGAAVGTATKYSDLLKKADFKNVESINNQKTDYKNATILISKGEEIDLKETIGEIKNILEDEYKTIATEYYNEKEKITIILGLLSVSTASPSPAIKH